MPAEENHKFLLFRLLPLLSLLLFILLFIYSILLINPMQENSRIARDINVTIEGKKTLKVKAILT